jgi:hypothetical protein
MFGPPRLFTIAAAALHAKLSADLDTAAASMPLPKLHLSPEQQAALLPQAGSQGQGQGQQQRPRCASASQPLPTVSRGGPRAASPRAGGPPGTQRGQPPPRQGKGQGQGGGQAPASPPCSALLDLDPERRLHSLRRPLAERAWQALRQPLRRLRLRHAAGAHKVFEAAGASQRSACRSGRSDRSACGGGSLRAGGPGAAHAGAAPPPPSAAAGLLVAEDLSAGLLLLAEEVDVAELLLGGSSRGGGGGGGSRRGSWRHVPRAPPPALRLEDTQRGAGLAAELLASLPQQGHRPPAACAGAWQGDSGPLEGSCHGDAGWLNWSAHAGARGRLALDLDGSSGGEPEAELSSAGGSPVALVRVVLEPSEHGAHVAHALLLLQAGGADCDATGGGPAGYCLAQRAEICCQGGGEICCEDDGEPLVLGCMGEVVETCGVCMDECVQVQVAGCRHRLCLGCCRELVRLHHLKPVSCPFCRTCIGGFELAQ